MTVSMNATPQAMRPNKIRLDTSGKVIRSVSVICITFFTLICLIPFVIMLSASFTNQTYIYQYGFSLLPRDFTLYAYQFAFIMPKVILGDYGLTIILTVVGTSVGLFLISMTGYALQRPDFSYRNGLSFFVYFTTLFQGGLIPYFIMMVNWFHLKNNYMAVLLPSIMSPWLLIMMKSFLRTIPHEMTEAAKIDGAGDFTVYWRVILPVAKPALATIGLFLALNYWNEWYNAMLFLDPNRQAVPLQYFLYKVVNAANFLNQSAAAANVPRQNLPSQTLQMAVAIIATGPIIFVYPFVQKYFISGLTVGSVKG